MGPETILLDLDRGAVREVKARCITGRWLRLVGANWWICCNLGRCGQLEQKGKGWATAGPWVWHKRERGKGDCSREPGALVVAEGVCLKNSRGGPKDRLRKKSDLDLFSEIGDEIKKQ